MFKIALRHPSGLEIEFEGDEAAFDRFEKFLAGDVGEFVQRLETRSRTPQDNPQDLVGEQNGEGNSENDLIPDSSKPLDPHAILGVFNEREAKTDIERVTILAQLAVDAGESGINAKLADELYDKLGVPKPSRWAKAFSNAKAKGLVRSEKHGVWRPTVNGENYAKHGTKPPRRPAPRRSGSSSAAQPELAPGETGDP